MAQLDDDADLWALVACRILPWVEQLDSLPVPSWRARFLAQVRSMPTVAEMISDSVPHPDDVESIGARMLELIEGGTSRTLRARASILGNVVVDVCAGYEEQLEKGEAEGTWIDVGHFLVDSVSGMLAAPVTHRGAYFSPSTLSGLL